VKRECDNLDAYLADELLPEAARQYLQHLDACDECLHAVDQQRWIDGLLQSEVRTSLETAPASLVESLREAAVSPRRRNVQLVAFGFAAIAAAFIIAVGWTVMLKRQAANLAATENAAAIATGATCAVNRWAVATDTVPPKAVFIGNGEAIAVPIENSDENVTVVRLYPTTDTERRLQLELALQTVHMESNGG
jgi:anti-sigma factor RsiW